MIVASLQEALRHHQAGRLDQAEELYREVLAAEPRQADALHLLGMAAHARGRFSEALQLVNRAIACKPNEAVFLANLGIVLMALGRTAEAETAYRRALALNPRLEKALSNLGNIHRAAWRHEEAIECYRQAIALNPDYASAHNNLGTVLSDQLKFDQAISSYQRAIALDGSFYDARKNLGIAHAEQGRWREAAAQWELASALRPNDGGLKLRMALQLPVIMESGEAIRARRRQMNDELDRLLREELVVGDPITETQGPAFYLAYHGENDRELQRKIAAVYARAVPSLRFTAPHCRHSRRRANSPLRVGIASKFFHGHSIGFHYGELFRSFPREQVRYSAISFPGPRDGMTQEIEQGADDVVPLPANLDQAREKLAACELDVLLYTDIGMDPWTYFLAFSRMAPVQCVTLGHPVTTGIATIDYFLSCVHLEPAEAEGHYSEQLVQLQNIPHYFLRPEAADCGKTRRDFPLPEEARWYVCQQTLFKIHPDFDELLGEILRRDPRGVAVLFDGQQPLWKPMLLERFGRTIPDVVERIAFLPRLAYGEYLDFLRLSDVLIDTVHFGAGTTTYHALAFGVPLVTLPGRYARGRGTLSAFRRIGLPHLACTSPRDYVERAVAIANDRGLRESIGSELKQRSGCLFENRSAARELEEFLVDASRRKAA